MLRKSPLSNALDAIFKNSELFKSYKLSKFQIQKMRFIVSDAKPN